MNAFQKQSHNNAYFSNYNSGPSQKLTNQKSGPINTNKDPIPRNSLPTSTHNTNTQPKEDIHYNQPEDEPHEDNNDNRVENIQHDNAQENPFERKFNLQEENQKDIQKIKDAFKLVDFDEINQELVTIKNTLNDREAYYNEQEKLAKVLEESLVALKHDMTIKPVVLLGNTLIDKANQ